MYYKFCTKYIPILFCLKFILYLYISNSFAEKNLYTIIYLYGFFLYTEIFTYNTLLHREIFTYNKFYIQQTFTHIFFYTEYFYAEQEFIYIYGNVYAGKYLYINKFLYTPNIYRPK